MTPEAKLLNEMIYAVQLHNNKGTVATIKRLKRAVADVLEKMLGRKPTKEEIEAALD